jgi:hypothetical protein
MWNIGENKYPQYAVVWEIDDKGTYAVVKLGTSRKDKKTDTYLNSNWSFVRFVGNAYKDIGELKEKDRIVIKSGGISQEPYLDKDGVKKWPKNPGIVVFAWEFPQPSDGSPKRGTNMDTPPVVEDELPF